MRKVLTGLVFLTLWAAMAQAGSSADEDAVRAVLQRQQQDWNRGDVKAFLEGYEHSDDTTFVGTSINRGYSSVLARYQERYPNRESMGSVTFSNLEVRMLGQDYASVLGRWRLERGAGAGGPVGGYFTLLLRKTSQGWKIFLDHTSVE